MRTGASITLCISSFAKLLTRRSNGQFFRYLFCGEKLAAKAIHYKTAIYLGVMQIQVKSMEEYRAFDIAIEHLEKAISLYLEEGPSFSVITLAGVADELFGKYVRENGKKTALESIVDLECEVHKIVADTILDRKEVRDRNNAAKNKIKHVNAMAEPSVAIELNYECDSMLERALENYTLTGLHYTDIMLSYVDMRPRENA